MKKIKITGVLLLSIFLLTGCSLFKTDTKSDVNIYTTIYPINYLITYLYGDNATIHSIYPTGVNINSYKISDKKLKEYSKANLFIFNSLDIDQKYAVRMVNDNSNLKLIDASLGMRYSSSVEELWLNPYNYLMMAQNVMDGLNEYIDNPYLLQNSKKNGKSTKEKFNDLKYDLSLLDASLKETTSNAPYTTIVCDNDLFKFLEKYNIQVISLEENDDLTQSTVDNVNKLMKEGKIKFVYTTSDTTNKTVEGLLSSNADVQKLTFNAMTKVDSGTDNENESYLTIMNNNIDLLKRELYK